MELTFGCEISSGIPLPFFLNDLEDKVNLSFQEKYYGIRIIKIYSGFICVSQEYEILHPIRNPKLLRKEPAIEFEYKLDFWTYKNMNDEQRQKYVTTEYLKNIKAVFEQKIIKDFDSVAFLKDLEIFFSSEILVV